MFMFHNVIQRIIARLENILHNKECLKKKNMSYAYIYCISQSENKNKCNKKRGSRMKEYRWDGKN